MRSGVLTTLYQKLLKVRSLQSRSVGEVSVIIHNYNDNLISFFIVYGFNLECWKSRYTTLLEGIFAALNLRIQALKLYIYSYIYIFEG